MPTTSLTLPGGLDTVAQARRFLAGALRDWGVEEYDFAAAQVLSELATNAVLHAHTAYTVGLRLEPEWLLIEVTDDSARLPQVRHYSATATTGRGMGLVAALSTTWGTTATGEGKTVWARVLPDDSSVMAWDVDDLDLVGDGEQTIELPRESESSATARDVNAKASA